MEVSHGEGLRKWKTMLPKSGSWEKIMKRGIAILVGYLQMDRYDKSWEAEVCEKFEWKYKFIPVTSFF